MRGNLTVDKSPSLQSGSFGDTVGWALTLRNTGLGTVYSATLSDVIGGGYFAVTNPSPTAPVDLAPNQSRTYYVTGTIASCTNLTNTVRASWSIGNADGTGTTANPVPDFTDILFQLTDPAVAVEIGALNPVPYCGALDQIVPITVTNTGGAARNLQLGLNAANLNVTEQSGDWSQAGNVLTYAGGTPPGTLGKNQTITFNVRVTSTNACATAPVSLGLRPTYHDACLLMQTGGADSSASRTLATDAPTLNVTKTGPAEVNAGESFQYQVTVSGANRQSITGARVRDPRYAAGGAQPDQRQRSRGHSHHQRQRDHLDDPEGRGRQPQRVADDHGPGAQEHNDLWRWQHRRQHRQRGRRGLPRVQSDGQRQCDYPYSGDTGSGQLVFPVRHRRSSRATAALRP